MLPIIMAGLSLLPKIPSMWKKVSGVFNKSVPRSAEEATSLASEIKDIVKTGKLEPAQQIALEKILSEHEEEMARIALEKEKLFYGELEGLRQLEIAAYNSGDKYIATTRPKLLRDWSKYTVIFIFYAPLFVLLAHQLGFDTTLCISMIKWLGGFVFGTFGSAFLGYTTARSIDKRNPNVKENENILGKAVKNILMGN